MAHQRRGVKLMSGAISPSFGVSPRLVSRSLSSVVPNTENALVDVSLSPLGFVQTTEGGGGGVVITRLPEWWGQLFVNGYDIGEGFQAHCLVSSGDSPNGSSAPVNTWIDMNGATISWQLFRNTVGTLAGTWIISIRSRGTGIVLAFATYTVTATKNP